MMNIQTRLVAPKFKKVLYDAEKNAVVKIGKDYISAADYVNRIDLEILMDLIQKPAQHVPTYNFARAQLEEFELVQSQRKYSERIKKYFENINKAVLRGAKQRNIDKLVRKLESFTSNYKQFAK